MLSISFIDLGNPENVNHGGSDATREISMETPHWFPGHPTHGAQLHQREKLPYLIKLIKWAGKRRWTLNHEVAQIFSGHFGYDNGRFKPLDGGPEAGGWTL